MQEPARAPRAGRLHQASRRCADRVRRLRWRRGRGGRKRLNQPRNETRPHAMRKQLTLLAAALAATALASCKPVAQATAAETAGEATLGVQRANAAVAKAIDLSDPASFADAR